jgi:4-diphosphocytidyl-2-C-methyl-D-erythritol kinase
MLAGWIESDRRAGAILFNTFERVAFAKFQALPVVVDRLRNEPGIEGVLMSGSGSACFALVAPTADSGRARRLLREALGDASTVVEGTIG